MLPSDTNLKIKTRTVGYNNKILVSDSKFSLGKNDKVNTLELVKHTSAKISYKDSKVAQLTTTHMDSNLTQKSTITHEEENCINTFFDWDIYDMVHVAMKKSTQ